MKIQEQWAPCPGFDGIYSVSNYGRVMRVSGTTRNKPGYLLDGHISTKGYRYVLLSNKKCHSRTVHSLVARAFLGEPKAGLQVNHKDGNKLNNFIGNLEYVTSRENNMHARRIGLYDPRKWSAPNKHKGKKLTLENARKIRWLSSKGFTRSSLALAYGVSSMTIYQIAKGQIWAEESASTITP